MTWFATAGGYEVFFNRDELRSRGQALAPQIHRRGALRFIAPLDADFGGSWIAVNECGVALALENGYTDFDDIEHEPPEGFTSRGLLLLSLVDCRSAEQVVERLRKSRLNRYRSFLLALWNADGVARLVRWIHGTLDLEQRLDPRQPLVSSAFETADVRAARSGVFAEMIRSGGSDAAKLHLAYHSSHLPERGPSSTCMHRPDARTVSFSRIRVLPGEVQFHYVGDSPCRGSSVGPPLVLPRIA